MPQAFNVIRSAGFLRHGFVLGRRNHPVADLIAICVEHGLLLIDRRDIRPELFPTLTTILLQKLPGACLPLEASLLCCDPEHLSNDTVLSEDIPPCNVLNLALPYHMHGLIALQCPLGATERAKP
jgi:hypothetical protein